MTKALEAFNDLKEGYTLTYTGLAVSFTKDFFDEKMTIIETALKQQENDQDVWERYLKEIKNLPPIEVQMKLKAFEIIKEKQVNVKAFIMCCNLKSGGILFYNSLVFENQQLTLEEFDLVKEVLK